MRNVYMYCDGADTFRTESGDAPTAVDPERSLLSEVSPIVLSVMGTRANIELVRLALRLEGRSPVAAVRVCGPPVCSPVSVWRLSAKQVLYRMQESAVPAAMGGFHAATADDAAVYDLVSMVSSRQGDITSHLQRHPAWPAVGFIAGLSMAACAEMLAEIIDPRWFVDQNHPLRTSRLRRHFGLAPWAEGETPPTALRSRRSMLTRCFGTRPLSLSEPGAFLSRYEPHVRVVKFLTFIQMVWLDVLVSGRDRRKLYQWFIPEQFFRKPNEVAAFKAHVEEVARAW